MLKSSLYLDGIHFGGEDHQSSVHLGKNFHMIQEKHVIILCSSTEKNVWQKLLILLGNNKIHFTNIVIIIFMLVILFFILDGNYGSIRRHLLALNL